MVNLLFPEVSVSDPLQQIRLSDQRSNRIDLEVSQASMPSLFELLLGLQLLDYRFNEHAFLQHHLIRNPYPQRFHVLADFVNQVDVTIMVKYKNMLTSIL